MESRARIASLSYITARAWHRESAWLMPQGPRDRWLGVACPFSEMSPGKWRFSMLCHDIWIQISLVHSFKPYVLYYSPTPVARAGACAQPQVLRSQRSRAHKPPPQPDASPDADPQMHDIVWSVRYSRCACAINIRGKSVTSAPVRVFGAEPAWSGQGGVVVLTLGYCRFPLWEKGHSGGIPGKANRSET